VGLFTLSDTQQTLPESPFVVHSWFSSDEAGRLQSFADQTPNEATARSVYTDMLAKAEHMWLACPAACVPLGFVAIARISASNGGALA